MIKFYPLGLVTALAALLWLSSCQKNTNELPPYYITTPFVKDATYKNTVYIRANFNESVAAGQGSVSTIFENLSGKALTNVKVVVEISAGAPTYSSCFYPNAVISVGDMPVGGKSSYFTLYTPAGFTLNPQYISVYLISFNGSDSVNRLNGFYSNVANYDTLTGANSFTRGLLSGIVQADGHTIIRYGNNPALNLTGTFTDTVFFPGPLVDSTGTLRFTAQTDTVAFNEYVITDFSSFLGFKLKLNGATAADTFISVKMNLRKN